MPTYSAGLRANEVIVLKPEHRYPNFSPLLSRSTDLSVPGRMSQKSFKVSGDKAMRGTHCEGLVNLDVLRKFRFLFLGFPGKMGGLIRFRFDA